MNSKRYQSNNNYNEKVIKILSNLTETLLMNYEYEIRHTYIIH